MNKELFNSAAKWALLLGAVMSVSRIYEAKVMISGDVTAFTMLTFEWIFVVALYFYIIRTAAKRRRDVVMAATPEKGYKVRDVMNYSIIISAMAAVIVGVSSHIYVVNVIGGYGEYAKLSAESIMKVISEVEVSQSMTDFYAESTDKIQEASKSAPSIFSTVISMVANYIISGFVIGGIIGLFIKQQPKISDNQTFTDVE